MTKLISNKIDFVKLIMIKIYFDLFFYQVERKSRRNKINNWKKHTGMETLRHPSTEDGTCQREDHAKHYNIQRRCPKLSQKICTGITSLNVVCRNFDLSWFIFEFFYLKNRFSIQFSVKFLAQCKKYFFITAG